MLPKDEGVTMAELLAVPRHQTSLEARRATEQRVNVVMVMGGDGTLARGQTKTRSDAPVSRLK